MSDITLRSQAMTNQSQQFYDSQRQESGQQMVNTLGQAGQMFVQRQQFAEQQQNVQRELAMREAESGMKMALFQQEQQQNAMKLQMMAAMDQADMGGEQVKQMKLQTKMLEAQYENQKKQTEQSAQQMVLDTRKSLFGDPRDAYEMGMVPDQAELLGYRKPKEGSTELADFGKRVGERNERSGSDRGFQELRSAFLTAKGADDMDTAEQIYGEMKRRYPDRMGSAVPEQPKQAPVSPERQQQVTQTTKDLAGFKLVMPRGEHSRVDRSMPMVDVPESDLQRISQALWADAEGLAKNLQAGYDRDPSRKGLQATPADGVNDYIRVLKNPSDPNYQKYVQILRAHGLLK